MAAVHTANPKGTAFQPLVLKSRSQNSNSLICCAGQLSRNIFLVYFELCVIAVGTQTFCTLVCDSSQVCVLVLTVGRTAYFRGRLNNLIDNIYKINRIFPQCSFSDHVVLHSL